MAAPITLAEYLPTLVRYLAVAGALVLLALAVYAVLRRLGRARRRLPAMR